MSLFATSFIRHILPVVAAYVTSPQLQETISVAVAAGVAFVWSAIEKQVTGTGTPQK
jgi:hypothetical protein